MNYAKNYHYISDKISQFTEENVNWIVKVDYYIDYNEYYEEISLLEVDYIYEDTPLNRKLKVLVKYSEVSSLNLKGFGGGFNQISGFKIDSMRDLHWQNDKNYYVHDYENGIMEFYCKSIEILSVEEL